MLGELVKAVPERALESELGLDDMVISLYAHGMSVRDIVHHLAGVVVPGDAEVVLGEPGATAWVCAVNDLRGDISAVDEVFVRGETAGGQAGVEVFHGIWCPGRESGG